MKIDIARTQTTNMTTKEEIFEEIRYGLGGGRLVMDIRSQYCDIA